MKLLKKMNVVLLILTALLFTSCEVIDALVEEEIASDGSTVHFHIHSSSSVDYAKITVNGITKSVSQVGDIDACSGANYVGLASFTGYGSSMSYVVKNLNGQVLTSGSVALTSKCIDFTFN